MRRTPALAIVLALVSALAFGSGGAFIKGMLEAGWSPAAAVTVRVLIAAAVLAVPALIALRWRLAPLWRARRRVLLFAVFAVAGVQVLYFAAIERIPVSTALLIEYLAPVGLVLVAWARTRHRPATVVLVGSVLSVVGLALVIGPSGEGLDPIGVLYAALAAVGLAAYFVIAASSDDLPPIALAASSLLVGGILLGLLSLIGLLPWAVSTADVALFGGLPWWVPLAVVVLVATALAYATGMAAAPRLGARLASFMGLLEVVFAGALAWLLLGEALSPLQLLGAALLLGGVLLVRSERPRDTAAPLPTETTPIPVQVA